MKSYDQLEASAYDPDHGGLKYKFLVLYLSFLVLFALNLYFVKPSIAGVPLRSAYAMALLFVMAMIFRRSVGFAVSANATLLKIILSFGVLGYAISVARGQALEGLAELFSIHVQGAVLLIVSSAGAALLGPRRLAILLIWMIGLSCLVGVAQWLGFGPAFDVRGVLGMNYDDAAFAVVESDRSPGLAYSTIFLAGQSSIAFALALIFYRPWNFASPNVTTWNFADRNIFVLSFALLCVGALFVVNTAGGNRSPLLGLLFLLPILLGRGGFQRMVLVFPLILVGFLLVEPLREALADAGLRIAETGDKSSLARSGLVAYGWQLFIINPFGYGLAFDSTKLYMLPEIDFSQIPNMNIMEEMIRVIGLHNFPLTMINRYGLLVLPLAFWACRLAWQNKTILLTFLPYMAHCAFHNIGPLDTDYVVWFAFGLIAVRGSMIARAKQAHATINSSGELVRAVLKPRLSAAQ